MTYQSISTILGLVIAGIIFNLLRRDHLHSRHVFWWISVALVIVLLGVFPQIINYFAGYLHIGYPPILLLIVAIGFILIKMLSIDLQQSRQERKIRRLTQQLALLEQAQRSKDT